MAHEEYLRRNLLVCSAIGATAGCRVALERLAKMKRRPVWMREALESIKSRVENLSPDLAAWRAMAPDAPTEEITWLRATLLNICAVSAEEIAKRPSLPAQMARAGLARAKAK